MGELRSIQRSRAAVEVLWTPPAGRVEASPYSDTGYLTRTRVCASARAVLFTVQGACPTGIRGCGHGAARDSGGPQVPSCGDGRWMGRWDCGCADGCRTFRLAQVLVRGRVPPLSPQPRPDAAL